MKKLIYGFCFLMLGLSVLFVPFARAAIVGEGLTISPPISEPNVKPGETVTETIVLTNPTSKLVEVYPQVMDFKAGGETGQPAFYTAADSGSKFSLASWISYNPSKIALTPEQVVNFTYKVTVPKDAEPGGHYGAVFFLSQPPKNQGSTSQVSVGSMVGSLVLVTVPGDLVQKGIIQSFLSDSALYITQSKASFITKITNTGNVHFKPSGNIEVKNMFGKSLSVINLNPQGGNVLPDSTRRFDNSWGFKWYQVGYFTANLTVLYGVGQTPLTATTNFWIIPIWLMIAIAGILVLLMAGMAGLISRRTKNPKKVTPTQGSTNPPVLR